MKNKKDTTENSTYLPLLPLRDTVIFPLMTTPLIVSRVYSLNAVDISLETGKPLFLCMQQDPKQEVPQRKSMLYAMGTAARIIHTLRLPDDTMKIVVEGMRRGKVERLRIRDDCIEVKAAPIPTPDIKRTDSVLALMNVTIDMFEKFTRLSQRFEQEIILSLKRIENVATLSDAICAHLPLPPFQRQMLLEDTDPIDRLELINQLLLQEIEALQLEQTVRERVHERMERNQREHLLQEQLRVIQEELGKEGANETWELRTQIEKGNLSKEAREKALQELTRYERMAPMSPESAIIRTYLDWLLHIPWDKRSRETLDIHRAQQMLDEDHYGLKKVKERILEFLAVRKLSKQRRTPVLCLVGPPGVGKTSLGKSIARAMNRKFVRISLGGVRDEAEIRGHRRTYIGALPGRIIQSMKKAGVKNPVFMMDEVDKMYTDYRGDPASALLEVLDPEQNQCFSDHYLEVDFDLSEVFFITTANNEYDIPHALHDRMEIVRISGYTTYEKKHIAQQFLIPRQMKDCGLTEQDISFPPEGLSYLILRYTQEAGVRELERQIARVCRKVSCRVLERQEEKKPHQCLIATPEVIRELLGPETFSEQLAEKKALTGLAMGLAWTSAGGDILMVESSIMEGKGEMLLTGQLGDIMKESAQAAHTYLRVHARELDISPKFHQEQDVHIHVPEGAIPKDGPSAGVTIAVSLLSALLEIPPREGVAMTGEITLRGRVLEVGGIKEKILAAHRAGLHTVILPDRNRKDLEEIPSEIKDKIQFVFVETVKEVFDAAFDRPTKKK